jgi:hypothetical protein
MAEKENPAIAGPCRLSPDIRDLLAIQAAIQRIPVANVRFLRDVHGQQISHPQACGIVAIFGTQCKP